MVNLSQGREREREKDTHTQTERERKREGGRKGKMMGWRTEGRVGRENGVEPRVRHQEGTGWV